jgi:hypothetical protein
MFYSISDYLNSPPTINLKHSDKKVLSTVVAKSFENDTNINFTKSAATVSLDIFVRCYYRILKYNYKHFISVKGFY